MFVLKKDRSAIVHASGNIKLHSY